MSAPDTQDEAIVVRIGSLEQLFNAPAVNPFSDNEVEIRGEAGMDYVTRHVQAYHHRWKRAHIVVVLPSDQISPGIDQKISEAIYRYCQARIARNKLLNHLTRANNAIVLGILLVLVGGLLIATSILLSSLVSSGDRLLRLLISTGITVVAWVSLWGPLDNLIFGPLPRVRENIILRRVTELNVRVEPAYRGSSDRPQSSLAMMPAYLASEPLAAMPPGMSLTADSSRR